MSGSCAGYSFPEADAAVRTMFALAEAEGRGGGLRLSDIDRHVAERISQLVGTDVTSWSARAVMAS